MISIFLAVAFYGVVFNPAQTNGPSASRIVPVNSVLYKMVQPDGVVRYLRRDFDRPGVILGKRPWVGLIDKNIISVWADPEATGGRRRTAFTFVDGQLRNLFLDGRDYQFSAGMPKLKGSLSSLWPEKKSRSYEKNSKADIWRSDKRLRLWFANPNSAGLFCVQVALLGWLLALVGRGVWRIHGLLWMSIATCCMAQSGSRGALLGFLVAAAMMAAFALRHCKTRRVFFLLIGVVVLVTGTVAVSGLAKRFTDTVGHVDSGNQRRLAVAKASMKMFADAPMGWHGGEVPGRNAALNWYIFDDDHVIRSHLLTLAELGWPVGFAYVFCWVFVIVLGVALARKNNVDTGGVFLLGEWSSFAVAGMFNPVYTEVSLWFVPLSALAWALWKGLRHLTSRALFVCGVISASVALAVVVIMILTGRSLNGGRKTSVRAVGKAAVVNGEVPAVWIVEDVHVLGGWGFPGREVLSYYAKHPDASTLGYVVDIRDLPKAVDRLVLPGRAAAEYLEIYRRDPDLVCQAKEILFLSPSVLHDKMDARLLRQSKVLWCVGSFALAHESVCGPFPGWVKIMLGIEQYVPNWMRWVVGGKF